MSLIADFMERAIDAAVAVMEIPAMFKTLNQEIRAMSQTIADAITALSTKIDTETAAGQALVTVVETGVTTLKDIRDQLAAAIADLGASGANVDALTALGAKLDAETTALAGAQADMTAAISPPAAAPATPPADPAAPTDGTPPTT